ncbi:MAG: deoxyhypusine synthase family protein [Candidatus Aenigmarchaeota archaeon]|nr:deoxyhypusine synthase family protein [Candidatus Aenigmarchaeota archaeon]
MAPEPHACHSKYLGPARAVSPPRIDEAFMDHMDWYVRNVDGRIGYQARHAYQAAQRWSQVNERGEYVWLGISGALTPAGLGGYVADLLGRGLVDVIVSTGANVFHDLHFACGLPVREGRAEVDDDDLRADGTTRIYNQNVSGDDTLKMQDTLKQVIARRVLPRLQQPFSSAMLLYEFGNELLNESSGLVVDPGVSFVIQAAQHGVPVYLDSSSNHSLGMDLSVLVDEGFDPDPRGSRDLRQASALVLHTQPQLNVFFGEGGPRNFIQTLGPMLNEVYYLTDFQGAEGCIRFTIADARAGALSGSTQAEAVTWLKYPDASVGREIEVWSEYTKTIPAVVGYVAKHASRQPRRLMDRIGDFERDFSERVILARREARMKGHAELLGKLDDVQRLEIEAREQVLYPMRHPPEEG